MTNLYKKIIEKHRKKDEKWSSAWNHYLPTTFVDIIIAKCLRALTGIKLNLEPTNEQHTVLADIIDSLEDCIMYARKLKSKLRDDK